MREKRWTRLKQDSTRRSKIKKTKSMLIKRIVEMKRGKIKESLRKRKLRVNMQLKSLHELTPN